MANCLILIYDNEAEWARADASVPTEISRRHGEFAQKNGHALRGGDRLAGSHTATSVRTASDGTMSVTDGTFAETKEVLGGYYVIEAADLDEALAIARQVPVLAGGVEVRPIVPS